MRRPLAAACLGIFILLWLGGARDEREIRDLSDRLQRLEQSVGQPPVGPLVPSVRRQLDRLEDRLERLTLLVDRQPGAGGPEYVRAGDFERVRRAGEDRERRLTELERAAGRPDNTRQVDLLQRQFSQLQRDLDRIRDRVSRLERARP